MTLSYVMRATKALTQPLTEKPVLGESHDENKKKLQKVPFVTFYIYSEYLLKKTGR